MQFQGPGDGQVVKNFIASLVNKLGYTIIPNWRLPDYPLARHLSRLFVQHPFDLVLDVGANAGQYRDFLRNVIGYRGLIISFEPVSYLYKHLVERAKTDPQWVVVNMALGAAPGEAELNVMAGDQFSSFLRPNNDLTPEYVSMNSVTRTEKVRVSTLDEMLNECPQLAIAQCVYLKMDTQGFDLEVVKGAQQTLSKVAGLQSEVSILPVYEGMPDYHQSIKTLQSLGYGLSGLFPVNLNQQNLVVEFDCVMLKQESAKPRANV